MTRYAMTKLVAGDYLLPVASDDGVRLYRLTRCAQPPSWDVFRWREHVKALDVEDWSRWQCVASCEPTRAAAAAEALRLR